MTGTSARTGNAERPKGTAAPDMADEASGGARGDRADKRGGGAMGGRADEPSSFPRLERTSVGLQAVETIKALIVAGDLQPGDALPSERELAVMLGISRPSLREAIRVLSAMNVVQPGTAAGPTSRRWIPACSRSRSASCSRWNRQRSVTCTRSGRCWRSAPSAWLRRGSPRTRWTTCGGSPKLPNRRSQIQPATPNSTMRYTRRSSKRPRTRSASASTRASPTCR